MSGREQQILIVDDEIHNRKLLELLLRSDGYQTRSAINGEDALASIAQHAPDLILLDIMMPGMDGFQVASILKAAPATANIPIIMVTALIDQASRLAGLNAGVEEFLTKPLDRIELSIRVRNLLRLKALADLLTDHNSILEQQVRLRTAALQHATHQAEQASRAKTEFLANMSHEIRTPMSAVVGLADLLGQTSLSEEQADILRKVTIASNALLVLLNNVLDLSKLEAGELIVDSAPFDLRALLQTQRRVYAAEATAKGIAFAIDAPDDLPTRLVGDANRLAQILSVLLSNAVKFTDHGAVSLCVRQSAVTAKRVTLCFVVRDTGIGIAADAQAGLFKPFVQGDGSTTRRHGGTGLGLSIARGLARLMGGSVGLSSIPGAGSEFTATLDFAPAVRDSPESRAEIEHEPGAGALRDIHALVVDDSDINLVLMKRLLEMHGATAELAANGLEALERLQARPDGFKVVLMDVQMPVLDGYAATQRIREELKLRDLPIIAVTAGALSSHRRLAAEAGMNDYVVKPFDSRSLVPTILRHVKPAIDGSSGQIPAAVKPPPQAAVPWPEIEGIASTDVRLRLGGDFALFRSLLTRLLDEFSDIAMCGTAQDADSLALCRARLHKLKGTAAMLGANAIQELAGNGEAAFASGDVARAASMATRIAIQLQRLREHALPGFLVGPA